MSYTKKHRSAPGYGRGTQCRACGTPLTPGMLEEGLCDACDQQVADGLLTVPDRQCPDCYGIGERFHNPPTECCGKGCCWDRCSTCGGSGELDPMARRVA